jgi:hypothetical protein
MIATLLSIALAVSAVAAPAAAAEDEVPAQRVTVEIVSANGSGCPVGTTEIDVAEDNTTFAVIHRSFVAKAGGGADPTDARQNCQLALQVDVPPGFTFGIVRADYRGHIGLQSGAIASQRANYYFQGSSQTTSRVHPFKGPLHDEWQTTDIVDPASIVFAPCGEKRLFNIIAELRVATGTSSPSATSWISMDSPDRNPNSRYHFAWKRC